jgi:hypothetical protein
MGVFVTGGLMNIKWAADAVRIARLCFSPAHVDVIMAQTVRPGTYCSAQGAVS